MDPDMFNLQREMKIVRSGVRQVFTPHQPIRSADLFFGRDREVGSLVENLSTPGQHSLLFGSRGVGKSSLANVACEMLLQHLAGGKLYQKRCDSTDNFESIFIDPLCDSGVDPTLTEEMRVKSEGGKAGLGIPGLSAGVHSRTDAQTKHLNVHFMHSPGWVADKIGGLRGLFLIDEADAITHDQDKKKLSELIKHLSDLGSNLKVLVVGIAETATELTAGHPSVGRCLKETHLPRMSNAELKSIIENGERKTGITFSRNAKIRIVEVSNGYPHFTHLLSLKATESAIVNDLDRVTTQVLDSATRRATNDAEGTLRVNYENAIRSHQTDEYRRILLAASACGPEGFSAEELRSAYRRTNGYEISQNSLNNHFKRLVSENSDTVLKRLAKGVYCFNDPRMPSFIRIANMDATDGELSVENIDHGDN